MDERRPPIRILVFLLLMSLAFGGCGNEEVTAPEADVPAVITVTDLASGGSTGLEVGHVLRVELGANEAAGYQWRFVEVDPAVLEPPAEQEYLLPDDETPGAPGTSIWRFEAVGPGTTTLRLEYVKAFEEEATPAKTFTFTVAVGRPAQD